MRYYIGIGSNLGHRQKNIQTAIEHIQSHATVLKKAYHYENPAWVPEGTQEDWNKPFINTAIAIDYEGKAPELLKRLKEIEKLMGRESLATWAPRVIDLDILLCEEETWDDENIQVPHTQISRRPFVLAPLRDLCPQFSWDGKSVLQKNRQVDNPLPLWMGIINVTPDSFSDGGVVSDTKAFLTQLQSFTENGISILDLGAESTRPGAHVVDLEDEWHQLKIFVDTYRDYVEENKPLLSIDTRHAKTAERSIEAGADYINDVSGLSDPDMFSLLKNSQCQFIFMHSLCIPADPKVHLPVDQNPVELVKNWLEEKINLFEKNNISLDRLTFDPGIGFGKTAHQSLELLKNIEEFKKYPVKILVGHSRKSFMKSFSPANPGERDFESIGISLSLAEKAIDIIRVHNPVAHKRAFCGWSHCQ